MKKLALVALALVVVVSAVGCLGPRYVSRGLDDWANQTYVNTPWLVGNTVSAALLTGVMAVTFVIDGVIDIYYFWAVDAQPFGSGKGTAFKHKEVMMPK